MLKRIGVVLAAAVMAFAALVPAAVPAAASHTVPRLTLQIDPKEGKVGTNVQTQVPQGDIQDVCLNVDKATKQFISFLEGLTPPQQLQQFFQQLIGGLQGGQIQFPTPALAALFVTLFADIATQQQVPGSQTGMWSPLDGKGSVVAPDAARPKLYAVVAVCLQLTNQLSAEQLQTLFEQVGQALQNPDQQTGFADAVGLLIQAAVNTDPDVAWVSLFCLLGDNGEGCAGPTAPAAEAVPGEPAFTG